MSTWARVITLLACGHLMFGAVQAQQRAQEDRPVFTAGVDLVTLPVSVLDSDELPVAGLTTADFFVLEDGVEQDVAMLLSPGDAPLDVALLMDVSSSMNLMSEAARAGALQFLAQLADDDCVLLLQFTATTWPEIWGSPRDMHILDAINETSMYGGSAIRDAIAEGFSRLEHDSDQCRSGAASAIRKDGEPQRRPALVVVTDGLDEHSAVDVEDLMSLTRQAGAPFFPVGFGEMARPWYSRSRPGNQNRGRLEAIARVTGGEFISGGERLEELSAAYEKIIRWLRSYYLVGYYPGPPATDRVGSELPSWHEVEVRVRRPGYRVLTREGHIRSPIDVAAADRHVQAGTDCLARGDTAEALVEFNLALESDPYSWEAHFLSGQALMRAGQMQGAQRALLSAAGLGPGRGQVHGFACRVSIALEDYETAWDQAIRAQQAGIDTTAELVLLRQRSAAPANLEERLRAPTIRIGRYRVFDLVEQAAMRSVSLVLSQELSDEPDIGLIDQEALADYWLVIQLEKLSEEAPRQLEADLELWESAPMVDLQRMTGPDGTLLEGEPLHRKGIKLSDIEDLDAVAAEMAPYIADLRSRLAELR